jgi:hypothetical protein
MWQRFSKFFVKNVRLELSISVEANFPHSTKGFIMKLTSEELAELRRFPRTGAMRSFEGPTSAEWQILERLIELGLVERVFLKELPPNRFVGFLTEKGREHLESLESTKESFDPKHA